MRCGRASPANGAGESAAPRRTIDQLQPGSVHRDEARMRKEKLVKRAQLPVVALRAHAEYSMSSTRREPRDDSRREARILAIAAGVLFLASLTLQVLSG